MGSLGSSGIGRVPPRSRDPPGGEAGNVSSGGGRRQPREVRETLCPHRFLTLVAAKVGVFPKHLGNGLPSPGPRVRVGAARGAGSVGTGRSGCSSGAHVWSWAR